LALTAAGNAGQASAAASLSSQAAANLAQLTALQVAIQQAAAQIAGGGSAAQLQQLLAQEETLRNTTNGLVNQLNALLTNNRNTPGVPSTTLNAIPGPIISSASVPV